MPKFSSENMDQHQTNMGGAQFQFSATRVADLGATEYTLVDLVIDESGSVSPFSHHIEAAIKEVIRACRRSPRADNLLIRVTAFSNSLREVHGYRMLRDINEDDYNGCIKTMGVTALFDATLSAALAMQKYAADLTKQDFAVNGALFVITDGEDNNSSVGASTVADAIQRCKTSEDMESIMPVLIGVNCVPQLQSYLDTFKQTAGFQQFVPLTDASANNLAKLGGFISQSISSQSQALGSGGPSKSLTF